MIGLVVDVETTGIGESDEIIEFGGIKVAIDLVVEGAKPGGRTFRLKEVARFHGMREPTLPMSLEISRITGLSETALRGKEIDYVALSDFLRGVDVFIAHNAAFDRRFLAKLFPNLLKVQWACTLHGIDWHAEGCSRRSLSYLANRYGVQFPKHRALADAETLLGVLQRRRQNGQVFFDVLLDSLSMSGS